MGKITWLNSQLPKTRGHVEHHSQVPKAIEQMYTNMTLLLKFSNWLNKKLIFQKDNSGGPILQVSGCRNHFLYLFFWLQEFYPTQINILFPYFITENFTCTCAEKFNSCQYNREYEVSKRAVYVILYPFTGNVRVNVILLRLRAQSPQLLSLSQIYL